MRAASLFSVMLLASCGEKPTKPSPPKIETSAVAATVSSTAPATMAAPASTASTTVAASVVTPTTTASAPAEDWKTLPIPELELGMMDHSNKFGWSKDNTEFMFCAPLGGTGGDYCQIYNVNTTKTERLGNFDEKEGDISPVLEKKMKDRLAKGGFATSKATLSDLTIIWRSTPGDPDMDRPVGRFEAGVRSLDKTKSATPIQMEFLHSVEVHPDTIEVSPDGKYLAVVAHGFFGEYSDNIQMHVIPVDSLRALLR